MTCATRIRTPLVRALGGLVALGCLFGAGAAPAAGYPDKPITVINPWTAGGPADTVARPILQKLSARLGQPVVMENKPGANGVIGSAFVARAAPDGYTLLFSHVGPVTISPAVQKDMPYDSVRDFKPITQVVSAPLVLLVRPSLPIHDLKELVEYARANPGKLTYGSVGPGSTTHLAGEILSSMAGVKLLHVPYKGAAPVINDMLGGSIEMTFLNIAGSISYVKAGQLRAIAVTTLKRSSLLPDLPTIAETYPGFEVNSWYGLMAPAKTPDDIVDLLQNQVAEIIRSPDIVELFARNGLAPEGTTPEQYARQIGTDLARWRDVVQTSGLVIEQ